jgi:predicted short-subunit dehydrogenase-like oxidoreductase (DUF2520 family)
MSVPDPLSRLWLVGPGRLGLALGWQLVRSGAVGRLTVIGRRPTAPAHPLFQEPAASYAPWESLGSPPSGIFICVPDSRIGEVAQRLADLDLPPEPVLHTSGVHGSEPLEPLAARGVATGSLHPLVALADPVTGAASLRGAWYGIEAEAEALTFATRAVDALEGQPLRIAAGGKPLYHAAAVFASNYVVTLLGTAEKLLEEAGLSGGMARAALMALAEGAVANTAALGPAAALTGPVSRGDVETLRRHLERLSGDERELYSVLARSTLELARIRGLDPRPATEIARLLGESTS